MPPQRHFVGSDECRRRTQADSDTEQARTGDYSRMEAAFQSGAQIICTDYYRPDPRGNTDENWTNYTVRFDDNRLAKIHSTVKAMNEIECEISK